MPVSPGVQPTQSPAQQAANLGLFKDFERDYNAPTQYTIGATTSGSPNMTLQAPLSQAVDGATIIGLHQGAACTLSTPSAPTATASSSGANTWSYVICALDGYGGITKASAAGTCSSSATTLSYSVYNTVSWSAVSGAVAYAVYVSVNEGAYTLRHVVADTQFYDMGSGVSYGQYFPGTPPTFSLGQTLVATILSGGGTVNLVLSANAGSTTTGQEVYLDCTAAYTAFQTDVSNGKAATLVCRANTYHFASAITLNPANSRIQCESGTTFDFWALGSGAAITHGAPSELTTATTPVENLTLFGPPYPAVTGHQLGSSTAWANQVRFKGGAVQGFGKQIYWYENAFSNKLDNMVLSGYLTGAVYVEPVSNSGEALRFDKVTITNGFGDGFVCNSSGVDSEWTGCSFDYQNRALNLSGGKHKFEGCHFESSDVFRGSTNTEYITINGSSNVVTAHFSGGSLVTNYMGITGRAQVFNTTGASATLIRENFNVNPVNDVTTLALDSPATTTARIIHRYPSYSGRNLQLSPALNYLTNAGFELGTLAGWTTEGTSTPTASQNEAHSGSWSCEFNVSGQSSYIVETVPCKPGDSAVLNFWYYVAAYTNGNLFWRIAFLDSQGNTVAVGNNGMPSMATTGQWVQLVGTGNPTCPPGASQCQLEVGFTANATATVYIDDLNLFVG